MRINTPVTQREQAISATANILSTTDLKGHITYVNRDFIEVSGFSEQELIGSPHNMVRHPDMPTAVFKGFWSDLQKQRSWMGIVKNRCKNGDHYWVDAYATPIMQGNETVEFQSVRRKARPEYVQRAERLYKAISAGRRHRALSPSISTRAKMASAVSLPFLLIVITALMHNTSTWVFISIFAALLLSLAALYSVFAPIQEAINKAEQLTNDPLARYVYTGRHNDGGSLLLAMKKLESENAALIGRVHDMSSALSGSAENLSSAVEQTTQGTNAQFEETDSMASAIRQLSVTVEQVAQSTEENASTTNHSVELAAQGRANLNEDLASARELRQQLNHVSASIGQLSLRSEGIEAILNVISSIAEQTNLLALNAAIEAARAGDSGRGFAVVADEVRALATRTQQATQEIRDVIDSLQGDVKNAVDAVNTGEEMAEQSVGLTERTERHLQEILQAFERIAATSEEIAQASREQSQVVLDMQDNVVGVRDKAEHNMQGVSLSAQVARHTAGISQRLQQLTLQFWQRQG